ncbi:MAG: hypothetical protein HYZ28_23160 [Myxococcales bacterium]|nr:hypothetical protein [Myxococcales bacterium]
MATDVNKQKWVEVLRNAGLDDAAMHRWHAAFEQRWPDGHQRFLEWLDLPAAEVTRIRTASRTAARP